MWSSVLRSRLAAVTSTCRRPLLNCRHLTTCRHLQAGEHGNDRSAAVQRNRKDRMELAAAFRILQKLDLTEGTCNHLTVMTSPASGIGDDVMLVQPLGMHWSRVTASSLLGLDREGRVVEGQGEVETTAACIHLGARVRSPRKCIMHLHPPYSTALGCLEDPTLQMIHQNSMRFSESIAYDHNFNGLANSKEEGLRLGQVLGDKKVLIMANHGVMTTGPSVAFAFDAIYYLERVAMFQMLAMSTGRKLRVLPDSICREGYPHEVICEYAERHFKEMVTLLQEESDQYAQ